MSLNLQERRRTRQELVANLELTGLTAGVVAADLGFTPDGLAAALALKADPADVWLLRDYVDRACRDQGRVASWSVLTDASRRRATMWFALREAPRHDFAAV